MKRALFTEIQSLTKSFSKHPRIRETLTLSSMPFFCVNKIVKTVVLEIFDRFWQDFAVGKLRGAGDKKMGADSDFLFSHDDWCGRYKKR